MAAQLRGSASTSSTNSATSAGSKPVAASTSTVQVRTPDPGGVPEVPAATRTTDGSPTIVVVVGAAVVVVDVVVGATVVLVVVGAASGNVVVVEVAGGFPAVDVSSASGMPTNTNSNTPNNVAAIRGIMGTRLTPRLYAGSSSR